MESLERIRKKAIESTKQKIKEDADRFLEQSEQMPSLEEYLTAHAVQLKEIWENVWLNTASNSLSRKEKKQFLSQRQIETEGKSPKDINRLFRDQLRGQRPFNTAEWAEGVFSDEKIWAGRFEAARMRRMARMEEQRKKEARWQIQSAIQDEASDYLDEHTVLLYCKVRHYMARKYVTKTPSFQQESLTFFEYLEEAWDEKAWHGQAPYYEDLEEDLLNFLFKTALPGILEGLPESLKAKYETVFHGPITAESQQFLLHEDFLEFTDACMEELKEEFIVDLRQAAEKEFNPDEQIALFEQAAAEREQREAAAIAAEKRRLEETEEMIRDIFGAAYTPSAGTGIKYILHIGDTNTGKTYRALERMKQAESGLYLAPLRLLAFEVYDRLNGENIPCSLKTGEEEKLTPAARHTASTVEMFREKDFHHVLVIDEAQMLSDKDRGYSWYRAITKARAEEVHIIGSRNIKEMLLALLDGCDLELHEYTRQIPLEPEFKDFQLKDTKKGDALICFSRRRVLETASILQRSGHRVSMIYGSMPPETRKKQMDLFRKGDTTAVVATDAIGMGLNLPVRRIVFLENEKFDGVSRRRLTSQEVKQIGGRAGRKGLYEIGRVAFSSDSLAMSRLLEMPDEPLKNFAIAPSSEVLERFQRYSRKLGDFFDLWEQFIPPNGTKKAALNEEKERYELVRDSIIEARLSLSDLYGFLHLPFSEKEPVLLQQWYWTLEAIARRAELPEPAVKTKNLDELELTYKAIGLHLLFLYRLGRTTEAHYWERLREEISDGVHEQLQEGLQGYQKKCRRCGKPLAEELRFPICDDCFKKGHTKKRRPIRKK